MGKVEELLQEVKEFAKTATPEHKLVVAEHLWAVVGEDARMNSAFRRQYNRTLKSLLKQEVAHV